ncbi:MAG: hypothetical protein L3J37_12995 [Rhodobacteraceae bacterium]|nr:hypothetical protein [Paracoccaceae bacterium]
MDYPVGFAVSLLVVIVGMVAVGISMLKSLTLAVEGFREFDGDSMTRRDKTRGWVGAVVWSLFAIVIWSFFIDWFWAGSLEYAQDAIGYRIENIARALSRN